MDCVYVLRLLGVDVFMPVGGGDGDLYGFDDYYHDLGIGYDKHYGRGIGLFTPPGYGYVTDYNTGYNTGYGLNTARLIRNGR